MADNDAELHQACTQRFIDLANALKDEGMEPRIVSAGLMTASSAYATFVAAGNEGGLTESGVDKVVHAYRQQLERIQQMKRGEL